MNGGTSNPKEKNLKACVYRNNDYILDVHTHAHHIPTQRLLGTEVVEFKSYHGHPAIYENIDSYQKNIVLMRHMASNL